MRAAPLVMRDLGQVVVRHVEADGARHLRHAATDAPHAEDAEAQLVHLPVGHYLLAHLVPFVGVERFVDEHPRAQCIAHQAGHVLDHGLRVGVRCVEDGDAAARARVLVHVVEPDARAAHRAQCGQSRQERLVDLRLGADHQSRGPGRCRLERG